MQKEVDNHRCIRHILTLQYLESCVALVCNVHIMSPVSPQQLVQQVVRKAFAQGAFSFEATHMQAASCGTLPRSLVMPVQRLGIRFSHVTVHGSWTWLARPHGSCEQADEKLARRGCGALILRR